MDLETLLASAKGPIYAAFEQKHGGSPEDYLQWSWGFTLGSQCLEFGLVHTEGQAGGLAWLIAQLFHNGRELIRPQRPASDYIIAEYGARRQPSMVLDSQPPSMVQYYFTEVMKGLDLDFHDFPMLAERVTAARALGWEECSTWMWFPFLQTRAERTAPRPEHRWSDKLRRCGWSNSEAEVPEWVEAQADGEATLCSSERGDFEPAIQWLARWGHAHPYPKQAVLAAMERGRHYASLRAAL